MTENSRWQFAVHFSINQMDNQKTAWFFLHHQLSRQQIIWFYLVLSKNVAKNFNSLTDFNSDLQTFFRETIKVIPSYILINQVFLSSCTTNDAYQWFDIID